MSFSDNRHTLSAFFSGNVRPTFREVLEPEWENAHRSSKRSTLSRRSLDESFRKRKSVAVWSLLFHDGKRIAESAGFHRNAVHADLHGLGIPLLDLRHRISLECWTVEFHSWAGRVISGPTSQPPGDKEGVRRFFQYGPQGFERLISPSFFAPRQSPAIEIASLFQIFFPHSRNPSPNRRS